MFLTSLNPVPVTYTPTHARLSGLPNGPAGTAATLRHMREFVRIALRDSNQTVRLTALRLIGGVPQRQWMNEIRELHRFVRDQVRYTRDPDGMELVQSPEKTLELRQGDCDDKSTLLAALLKSVGHPAQFVAVGFRGQPFSHVYVETQIKRTGSQIKDWLPLETILPGKNPGWYPKGVTSRYVLRV